MAKLQKKEHFDSDPKGMTIVELIISLSILGVLIGAVVISFSGTFTGREVEGETEKLAALIRSAQSRALDTKTVQAIFLSQKEVLWTAYPGETIEEVKLDADPSRGEEIKRHTFRNNIGISELWLDEYRIEPISQTPEKNIAAFITEKGEITKTNIIVSTKETTNQLTAYNREVAVGKLEKKEPTTIILSQSLEPSLTYPSEKIIICKTEHLLVRGWQTIKLNNVEKVKEVELKVKLDLKLPQSAHLHVYVFPGKYEIRKSASGVYQAYGALGNWNADESELILNAKNILVPVFGQTRGYYAYSTNSEAIIPVIQTYPDTLPNSYPSVLIARKSGSAVPWDTYEQIVNKLNTLNPGTFSDFPLKNSTVEPYTESYSNGFVHSDIVACSKHDSKLSGIEIRAGEENNSLTIAVPENSNFLRIVLAAYHRETNEEQLFNCYPTTSSTHFNKATFNSFNLIDYQTDPMIPIYPWYKWGNNALWLSNYAYALKPLARPSSVDLLAVMGPYLGDNYKGFWYGPVLLDWDKLVGEEGVLQLLGWTSSVFNFSEWSYTQIGNTYEYGNSSPTTGTHYAASSHFWLKNFAFLSYWLMFQHTANSMISLDLPKSLQDNSAKASLRFQEPLHLQKTNLNLVSGGEIPYKNIVETGIKLLEEPERDNYDICKESSSLSLRLVSNPQYPVWLPNLPCVFGQMKIMTAPDLYGSFYYLQERINHIMNNCGMWYYMTEDPFSPNIETIFIQTSHGPPPNMSGPSLSSLGNLEYWTLAPQSPPGSGRILTAWWQWYQTVSWAKGQVFPDPRPNGLVRTGWEIPVISPIPPYESYSNHHGDYTVNETFENQVVNLYSTLYFSTAHYPLGTIQIAVKRK